MSAMQSVSAKDRDIVRDLARRVAEIGNDPVQQERAELWRTHNDLGAGRPLVLIYPENAWGELLTDKDLKTSDTPARWWEMDLRMKLHYWEHMRDDNVIEPAIVHGTDYNDSGWGVEEHVTGSSQHAGAAHYDQVIRTEEDVEKIKIPTVTVNMESTERNAAQLHEVFGDILRIERRAHAYNWNCNMDLFARWRGLDQIFLDLVDRPEWVHRVMEKMYAGLVACHEAIIASGVATLNNRNDYAGSGGNSYTSQLPQKDFDGVHVRSKDLWAMATTQIFSAVSPAMHEEFTLQYERRYLARFGLACYGCCEPLHDKLEIVKTIPNLRRISISPWADVRKCAEQLGGKYIFSWKPNPAVMAGETWDPARVRKEIRETLAITAAHGCVVEIVMKDTHTCRNKPERMSDWVRIAKEEAEASVR